ncbi:hypothetical protein [Aureibacter tunicatorum]|uniref:Uncharacterized protein n=1 Tax=Aureibacter tunicatorum TaxID=866807 RepID=A0AAE3XPZ7_9BACT|nr:hypothetical protein [Aureibacter tunicatorum]MDR6241896.1 hypothetical protein [Aureibacter tunicatorum]
MNKIIQEAQIGQMEITFDLYSNQMKKYDLDSREDLPAIMLDIKNTDFHFQTDRPQVVEAEFSLFFVTQLDGNPNSSAEAHLNMIDSICQEVTKINRMSADDLQAQYSFSALSGDANATSDCCIRQISYDGKIETARTQDFAYDNLRINALAFKGIMNHYVSSVKNDISNSQIND